MRKHLLHLLPSISFKLLSKQILIFLISLEKDISFASYKTSALFLYNFLINFDQSSNTLMIDIDFEDRFRIKWKQNGFSYMNNICIIWWCYNGFMKHYFRPPNFETFFRSRDWRLFIEGNSNKDTLVAIEKGFLKVILTNFLIIGVW